MKAVNIFLILFVVLLTGCIGEDEKGSIKVMSLNIRYDNPADSANAWDYRKDLLIRSVVDISPDVIGFQEVLAGQLNELDSLLPWYDYVGVGRDDGLMGGEFSPIFYKMNRFNLLDHGSFWLSPWPDSIGSVGWDAALTRIASWAKFHDKHISHDFLILNTHFDHSGDTSRFMSAQQLLDFIDDQEDKLPVILTGDFNAMPESEPINLLRSQLNDAHDIAYTGNRGINFTFNGFGKISDSRRVDYIFVDGQWKVYEHYIMEIREDGLYISDHYPIVGIVKMK